jgi:Flp pilus assembly protein TadD
LNIAAILLKNKEYSNVITELKKALEIEPSNVKALYRRGIALSGTGDHLAALSDLNKASELEPENKEIRRELVKVKQLQKAQDDKDKNLYSRMLQGL